MQLKDVLHLGVLIMRGYSKAIENSWDKFAKKYGLSSAHHYILYILFIENELTIGEIAEVGLWHNSTVTRLISSLKKKDLVSTKVDNKDSRITTVRLSESGKMLIEKINREALEDPNYLPFFKDLYEKNPEFITVSINRSKVLLDIMQGEKYVEWIEKTQNKINF
jgi:MarR family protease production transcriptional regulator HPr